MHDHAQRRDYLISEAIRAGKFTAARAQHYRQMYDRDPAGTEQLLAALAPAGTALAAAGALAGHPGPQAEPAPYPRELFPELARHDRHAPVAPALAAVAAPQPAPPARPAADPGVIPPEQVARWSAELFPETQAARGGRVTRAND